MWPHGVVPVSANWCFKQGIKKACWCFTSDLPLLAKARADSSSNTRVCGSIMAASAAGIEKAWASKQCTEDTNAPNLDETRPVEPSCAPCMPKQQQQWQCSMKELSLLPTSGLACRPSCDPWMVPSNCWHEIGHGLIIPLSSAPGAVL